MDQRMGLKVVDHLLGDYQRTTCSVVLLIKDLQMASHQIMTQDTGISHRLCIAAIQTTPLIQNHH
jgi:hypothetical protein